MKQLHFLDERLSCYTDGNIWCL